MKTTTCTRTSAAVAALGLLLAVPTATAAPRRTPAPICNLVSDPQDVPDRPSLDVLSADVATNATMLTSVIRVKGLAANNDPRTLAGRRWVMAFKADTKLVQLNVVQGVTGARAQGQRSGAATVVKLDLAKNEVRYTIPLKDLPHPVVPGKTVLSAFTVTTWGYIDPVVLVGIEVPDSGDTTAVSSKVYKAGSKSCVTVG